MPCHPLRSVSGICVVAFLATLPGTPAAAQIDIAPPELHHLEAAILSDLPAWWTLAALRLGDPVPTGTPIAPQLGWRFEADLAPVTDLYVPADTGDTPLRLLPSAESGAIETAYGTLSASYAAGSWSIAAGFETAPHRHRGLPTTGYAGAAVVVGSAAEAALLRRLAREDIAAEDARLRREAETAQLRMDAENHAALDALRAKHATALETLKAEAAAEIAQLEARIAADARRTQLATQAASALSARRTADADLLAEATAAMKERAAGLAAMFDELDAAGRAGPRALIDMVDSIDLPDWMLVAIAAPGGDGFGPDTDTVLAALQGAAEGAAAKRQILHSRPQPPVTLWADRLVDFSSEYGGDWGAREVLGEPTIATCGDIMGAWTTTEGGPQHVTVAYPAAVVPTAVAVHENNAVGFVTGLVLYETDGTAHAIDVADNLTACPGQARFEILDIPVPIASVRVVIDGDHAQFEQIDAIALEGFPAE